MKIILKKFLDSAFARTFLIRKIFPVGQSITIRNEKSFSYFIMNKLIIHNSNSKSMKVYWGGGGVELKYCCDWIFLFLVRILRQLSGVQLFPRTVEE
jgi:hypothetical protein